MQVTTFRQQIILRLRRVMAVAFAGFLVLTLSPGLSIAAQQPTQESAPVALDAPEQLQQLVAPIALYPDALVAQILAAATYPTQVVQADRWLQQHPHLQGEQLAGTVDQQSWDPSVKALTAFPSVLANLDQNLSWTEALGNAYFNQQQDVLDAVQVMRRRAEDAGHLRTTPQETVLTEGATIVIQPVASDLCYLPVYDPWIVYGAPVAVYPGYFFDGWVGSPFISFGPAIGLGFFGRYGWGWPAWGFNWRNRVVVFNHNTYFSRSRYFINHGPFIGGRGFIGPRRMVPAPRIGRSFNRSEIAPNARINGWANRGPVGQRTSTGPGGFNRGPVARSGSIGTRSSPGTRGGFSRSNQSGGMRGGGSHGGGGGRHR